MAFLFFDKIFFKLISLSYKIKKVYTGIDIDLKICVLWIIIYYK